jgi:TolA-binding protein
MNERIERQQLAEALSVRWNGTLEETVRRRIDERLARRARRQSWSRRATLVLALCGVASLVIASLAGVRPWRERGASRRSAAVEPLPRPVSVVPEVGSHGSHESPAAPIAPVAASSPTVTSQSRSAGRESRARSPAAPQGASDPVEALLERADRARLAGHPNEAVAPLSDVMNRYPADPRASLAAFQLGRVLADDLGDPVRAAQAFDRAQALAPAGPLESEARARTAEARRAATACDGGRTP